jgi:peptidoglycan-associated lipoprotein
MRKLSQLNKLALVPLLFIAACASKTVEKPAPVAVTNSTSTTNGANAPITANEIGAPSGQITTNETGGNTNNGGTYNYYGNGANSVSTYGTNTPLQSSDAQPNEAMSKTPVPASIAQIGERVFFETDSYSLTENAQETLQKQAHFLMARPNVKVLIAGNCDERGTREYNLALGARRANSVRDYLISLGVNAAQLSTISYGKERPVDPRPNEDGWAINRNAHSKVK